MLSKSALRRFSTLRWLQHENPLGLPRSNAPPKLPRMQRGLPKKRRISGAGKVIAVSSAKGGVGKSTIAANIALSFARSGLRSGILDTDIFGPSIPTLFKLEGQEPQLSETNQLVPLTNYGVKSMSMGYLVGADAPVVWRGLMVMKAIQQLLHEVEWGGLDVLVMDLPPGTGDVQLTITQQVEIDGAIIVSTPQDIALKDAIRGVKMFEKLNVPILGLVENMSHFTCPVCSTRTPIFPPSTSSHHHLDPSDPNLNHTLPSLGVPLIGSIPLAPRICADADAGKPTVVAEPESERAGAMTQVASQIRRRLAL